MWLARSMTGVLSVPISVAMSCGPGCTSSPVVSLTGMGEPSTARSVAQSGIVLGESASYANSVLCIDAT